MAPTSHGETTSSRAPSPTLPLRYLVTAAAAFVLAALALPWLAPALAGHYYQPRVFALVHTVTLGWITLSIMGASYQLIPIVLERPLWSERLARAQFVLMVIGVIGVVGHFFIGQWSGWLWSAALVAVAVAAHLTNAAMSLRGAPMRGITGRLVVLAFAALALTTVFGALLGLDHVVKVLPASVLANVHAHVHLALLGFVLPMVIGVAARVYPMFLLVREPAGRLGALQVWGLTVGVPLIVAGVLIASDPVVMAGALAVAAAIGGHVAWVLEMVRTRRRPALDWGLRLVLGGTAFLVLGTVMGLALATGLLAGPRWALAYGVVALGGWASLTIAGMLLKIVPFLVWYSAYASRVGREPVPTLAQLSWIAGERVAATLLIGGIGALALAVVAGEPIWIRAAGVIIATGALTFAATLARVLHHLMPCPARHLATATGRPS
jgi:hypothetical protein